MFTLTPEKEIIHAMATHNPDRDCGNYFGNELIDYLDWIANDDGRIDNNLIVKVDLKDEKVFLALPGEGKEKILPLLLDPQGCGVTRIRVIPLVDLCFCSENCINPLEPEGEHDKIILHKDYNMFSRVHGNLNPNDQSMYGIRTDLGLHLFSNEEVGDKAMEKCIAYYSHHFFDKNRGTDRFDIVTVWPLLDTPRPAGDCFAKLADVQTPLLDLPKNYFNEEKGLLEMLERKLDMLPTLYNEYRLRTENGFYELTEGKKNHDFISLVLLREGVVEHPDDIEREWYQEFSYNDNFHDLVEEMNDCGNQAEREEVSGRIRELSGRLIEENFPDLRYCREPVKIEEQLRQQHEPAPDITEEIPEPNTRPKIGR